MRIWRHYLRWFVVAAFLLLFASGTLFAQASSGTLRGTVADPTGAVIPGAVVTATSATGQKTSSVTDNVGNYEIKGLAPGTYTVNANAKGFSRLSATECRRRCWTSAKVGYRSGYPGRKERRSRYRNRERT